MSADPNKKSARTFQCRDVLWETFEQMARELECSIDYLINESMKQYARQRRRPACQGCRGWGRRRRSRKVARKVVRLLQGPALARPRRRPCTAARSRPR
jgi:hypothetical protein